MPGPVRPGRCDDQARRRISPATGTYGYCIAVVFHHGPCWPRRRLVVGLDLGEHERGLGAGGAALHDRDVCSRGTDHRRRHPLACAAQPTGPVPGRDRRLLQGGLRERAALRQPRRLPVRAGAVDDHQWRPQLACPARRGGRDARPRGWQCLSRRLQPPRRLPGRLPADLSGCTDWLACLADPDQPSRLPGSQWFCADRRLRLGPVAAASPDTLAVATGGTGGAGAFNARLFVSTDAGRHWSSAATDTQQLTQVGTPASLGFATSGVGWWVGDPHNLWTTRDGGRHWTEAGFG